MKQMDLEQFTVSFLYININAWLRDLLIWHQRLCGVSCFVFLKNGRSTPCPVLSSTVTPGEMIQWG